MSSTNGTASEDYWTVLLNFLCWLFLFSCSIVNFSFWLPFSSLILSFSTLVHLTYIMCCHNSVSGSTWQHGGTKCNGGTAMHWPFSAASSLPTPHQMSGLCHLSHSSNTEEMSEQLELVSSSHPGLAGDMAQSSDVKRSKMPVELPGQDQRGDPMYLNKN